MRLLHSPARTQAVFDDPNLLAHAGLAPLMTLAERAGLTESLAGVRPAGPCGANAATKAACLVAGMAAGADSIDDMDLLRDGAMDTLFSGVRAPSTLGSYLRSYSWGNVRQLDAACRQLTTALAEDPRLLPGREELAFIDIDSTQHRVFGYRKEGAAFGHAKIASKPVLVKGLNPLISIISSPLAAPVPGPGQGELFPAWRYHAVFTDSPFELVQSEAHHRDHAIVEQVIADLGAGPLAHLPSGVFTANAAWLVLAAMAHNLLRAAGTRTGVRYAKARTATIRRDLVTMPARTARHGRGNLTLHLPQGHHRAQAWLNLWTDACGPPARAA